MAVNEDARWALLGEAVVAFAPRPRRLLQLPKGFHRLPGPALILAERFVDSPVGPFLSLAFGEPARLGAHPGYYFGMSVLNSANARRAGRQYWGFPHELGALQWISEGTSRGIIWDERGIEVRGEIHGRPLPLLVPLRTMQRRSDGPVVVPAKMKAMARPARVSLITPADDLLVGIAGEHRGLALSGMLIRRTEARRPMGWFSTFKVSQRAPEPGIIGMDLPLNFQKSFQQVLAEQLQ